MKHRIARLFFTSVLLFGLTAPAFAMNREGSSPRHQVRELIVRAIKQVKSVLRIAPHEEYPLPPRPCTPGTPGCP